MYIVQVLAAGAERLLPAAERVQLVRRGAEPPFLHEFDDRARDVAHRVLGPRDLAQPLGRDVRGAAADLVYLLLDELPVSHRARSRQCVQYVPGHCIAICILFDLHFFVYTGNYRIKTIITEPGYTNW